MDSLTLNLQHCYGIKRLRTELAFSTSPAIAIYAPNGVMKSSLAQVFKDIADGNDSRDRVFPHRVTTRTITFPDGRELGPESVLVLPPYEEVFGDADKTATLLVDARLRKEYESLFADIDKAKALLLRAVSTSAATKKDMAVEITTALGDGETDLYALLNRIRNEIASYEGPSFANVPYDLISDERVAALLATQDIKTTIETYIQTYNKLLAASKYFKKGTFEYHNASTVGKTLATSGFFEAKHSVTLVSDTRVEVTNAKQLDEVIAKEKEAILKDAQLRQAFNEVEKRITKNELLRDLQAFLAEHEEVLTLMADLNGLKRKTLLSYLRAHSELLEDLLTRYTSAEKRSKEIEAEAARQRTQWEAVIELFNRRFFVPFSLSVTNRVSVILGDETVPALGFTFRDGEDSADLSRVDLLRVLSTGERKALYILNVIFQVEVRRQARQDTLFVVDDIADSFDYKNKYAIIQYLKDIADETCFRQLILTHNFDFFRTVQSRFVRYSDCLMVQRTAAGLDLVPAVGIKNIFVNDWKPHFHDNARKRVAAVSFLRNIIEYTRGVDDADYLTLTKLLHWRPDSSSITHAELDQIYGRLFGAGTAWPDPTGCVIDTVRAEAELCLNAPEGLNLENKIVLSIAARLHAERHMAGVISDPAFLMSIGANQTARLLAKYKTQPTATSDAIQLLDEVVLVTPENIHLNAFMYEPILDMADDHLRSLYLRIRVLT
ncbi:MAG: phage infection protein [Gemmatimonadetes bacterium]|nr:phage infection protein [Gemmatimonadota bacterium]